MSGAALRFTATTGAFTSCSPAGKKPSVSFTPSIMEDVRLNYGDSNKALNETFDLHMEKYDYIISQS